MRPQMIESDDSHQPFSSIKQWQRDEELSFMMERYLESAPDAAQLSQASIQPSPGQQSTDSGFLSDVSQTIVPFADQSGLPYTSSTFDPACYSGYNSYFDSSGGSHTQNCSYYQHDHYHQSNCSCMCGQGIVTSQEQPSWESESYNHEDLSKIVDQVLNSIDAQFNDLHTNSTSSLWTNNATEISSYASKTSDNVEKLELCDNCGNLMNTLDETCKSCGHLIIRTNENSNTSPTTSSIDAAKKILEPLSNRVCAVQPAIRNVGVVEPRVVVKIPWAKVKPSYVEGQKEKLKSDQLPTDESSSETIEETVIRSEAEISKNDKKRKRHETEIEDNNIIIKKRRRKTSEETLLQPFSITQELPEHFRQALRERCIVQHLDSQKTKKRKRKKKKKEKKKKRREEKASNEKLILLERKEGLPDSTDDDSKWFGNPLKLIRPKGDEIESNKTDNLISNPVITKPVEQLGHFSQSQKVTFGGEGTKTAVEPGFSRYKDTCLDFGDLVRQSKQLQMSTFGQSELWSNPTSLSADHEEKTNESIRERKKKCKKSKPLKEVALRDQSDLIDSCEPLTKPTTNHDSYSSTKVKLDIRLSSPHRSDQPNSKSNNLGIQTNSLLEIPKQIPNFKNTQEERRDLIGKEMLKTKEESHQDPRPVLSAQTNYGNQNSIKNINSSNTKSLCTPTKTEELAKVANEHKCEMKDKQVENTNEEIQKSNEEKPKKKVTKFSIEKETDGKWMYCKIEGCHFWTRKQIRMSRHSRSHIDGDENKLTYQCPDCKVKISSLAKLLRHDRKFHTGFKDYECKICEAEVTDIAVHMRVHRSEKQFTCNICTIQFRHKNSLVRHLFQHSGERPFRCQNCETSFTNIHRMREHIKKKHPTSQAAKAIGIETNYLNLQNTRSYAPIAPAPAPRKLVPTQTTLLLQPQVQPQPMTSLVLNNGTLYLMNQPTTSFQQPPLLLSMPTQQPIFYGSAQLQSFLQTTNNASYIISQPAGLSLAPQQPIYLPAAAAPGQLSLIDNQQNKVQFMDGSFSLESNDRLTYKAQNGEMVKLDILERAILEIPNLSEDN